MMTNDQYLYYKCLRTIKYGLFILRKVFVKVVLVKTRVPAEQFTKPKTTSTIVSVGTKNFFGVTCEQLYKSFM